MREWSDSTEQCSRAVQAASEILLQHERFVRAIIQVHARNACEEDDLHQNLFLYLVCNGVPDDLKNARGYLYTIISHQAVSAHSEERVARRHEKKVANDERFFIHNDTPESALIVAEEQEAALKCITERLCPREAAAMTLRYREGCSVAEIAHRMGVARRTVSKYLSSGMRTLKRFMKR